MDVEDLIKSKLREAFNNLIQRQSELTLEDIEPEIINQACKFIIENHKEEINSVHDINLISSVVNDNLKFLPIAKQFVDFGSENFPDYYTEMHQNVALSAICSNISWKGMWAHLRNYFQKKHGYSIDTVESKPTIFYSTSLSRFENDVKVNTSVVERNINVNYFNDRNEMIVSIEPTLSTKKGKLHSKDNNTLIYHGLDPDYIFYIKLDRYDEIEEFILELPNSKLKLVYS